MLIQFPAEMTVDISQKANKKSLARFLESKLDATSFDQSFRFLAGRLCYLKQPSCVQRQDIIDGKRTPYFLIKQIFVTMGALLITLASREDAMPENQGRTWEGRGPKTYVWAGDGTYRLHSVARVFDLLATSPQFKDIELADFIWEPIINKKEAVVEQPVRPAQRASDAALLEAALMFGDDDGDDDEDAEDHEDADDGEDEYADDNDHDHEDANHEDADHHEDADDEDAEATRPAKIQRTGKMDWARDACGPGYVQASRGGRGSSVSRISRGGGRSRGRRRGGVA